MAGEAVYGGYDQAALDAQYNNRARVPEFADYLKKFQSWSADTRGSLKGRLNLAYGDGPAATLDIFPANVDNAPLWVFVHGGYWQSLDKDDFSYVARGMVPNGVTTALINYPLAPSVGMDEIVGHNRMALAWLWRNAADLGVDRDRIHTCGHSAGGHLVMMLLATDWPSFGADLPADLVKSGCPISGLYDLEPIRLCYLNEKVGMDADVAKRNTPLLQTYPVKAPALIVLGGDESEDYHRQTHEMTIFWQKLGYPTELMNPIGLNHFSIVDALNEPGGDLVKAQLANIL